MAAEVDVHALDADDASTINYDESYQATHRAIPSRQLELFRHRVAWVQQDLQGPAGLPLDSSGILGRVGIDDVHICLLSQRCC